MDQMQALLALPLATLAVLASGYLGYRVAYVGKDHAHQTIDVLFMSIVFAAASRLATLIAARQFPEIISLLAGMFAAVALAAIWRRWLSIWWFNLLRWMNISTSDRHLTAWQSILDRGVQKPSQLIVKKQDGTLLMSERLADFDKAPMGPCILGQDGSVALYVTH